MLILTGGAGLEVLGVTDWSDDSNDDEPIYIEYGGCLDPARIMTPKPIGTMVRVIGMMKWSVHVMKIGDGTKF